MAEATTKTETGTAEVLRESVRGGALSPILPVNQQATPDAMLMYAMSQGATLEHLEKLYALKRQWEQDEARKAFVADLAAFKAEPLEIRKNKKVGYTTKEGDFVGYEHADLAEVVRVVAPALARHSLAHRWDVARQGDRIHVTCILQHAGGHSEALTLDGAPDNSGKKNPLQQVASTITFLERYTLMALCGVAASGDDDDGRGAGGDDGTNETANPHQAAIDGMYDQISLSQSYDELANRKDGDGKTLKDRIEALPPSAERRNLAHAFTTRLREFKAAGQQQEQQP